MLMKAVEILAYVLALVIIIFVCILAAFVFAFVPQGGVPLPAVVICALLGSWLVVSLGTGIVMLRRSCPLAFLGTKVVWGFVALTWTVPVLTAAFGLACIAAKATGLEMDAPSGSYHGDWDWD